MRFSTDTIAQFEQCKRALPFECVAELERVRTGGWP